MGEKVEKIRLRLNATIGGIEFDDIVSASATFGLNSIPTAQLVVAVGKDYSRGGVTGKPATIHTARSRLRPRDPVVLTLTMETARAPGNAIATYKIFEGYLSGIGYQRSHNQANFVIGVVHWLDDLNNSGAATGNWMAGSAYDLAQCAIYNSLYGEGAGVGLPTPILDPSRSTVNLGNAQEDVWMKVLLPTYKKMAEWAKTRQQSLPGSGLAAGANSAAIGPTPGGWPGALLRMPGNGARYYTPVGLDLNGLGPGNREISDSLRAALQIANTESFAYTTFWNKLVGEAAPQLFFAISPAVDWALPVPFFAGLRTEWKTIEANDYSYANFNANMSQLLESVDVFYPVGASPISVSGVGCADRAPGFERPLGFFPANVDQNKQGLKLYKEPPAWLSNPVSPHANAPGTTGAGGPAPGDTTAPNYGARQAAAMSAAFMINLLKQSKMGDRLAEHWYKTEYLQQRFGELSGRLRFDIAPGSTVRIETPPRDVTVYGDTNNYMFANVVQVSYVINAERATAGTAFTLSNIRSDNENKDDNITADIPPLFNDPWTGGPLADPM